MALSTLQGKLSLILASPHSLTAEQFNGLFSPDEGSFGGGRGLDADGLEFPLLAFVLKGNQAAITYAPSKGEYTIVATAGLSEEFLNRAEKEYFARIAELVDVKYAELQATFLAPVGKPLLKIFSSFPMSLPEGMHSFAGESLVPRGIKLVGTRSLDSNQSLRNATPLLDVEIEPLATDQTRVWVNVLVREARPSDAFAKFRQARNYAEGVVKALA